MPRRRRRRGRHLIPRRRTPSASAASRPASRTPTGRLSSWTFTNAPGVPPHPAPSPGRAAPRQSQAESSPPSNPISSSFYPVRQTLARIWSWRRQFQQSIEMNFDLWIVKVKKWQHLADHELQSLCEYVNEILIEETNVQLVNSPVTVCGDIQGQFHDLMKLFVSGAMSLTPTTYLWLLQGDFVDRGFNSLEVFSILLLLKARYCIVLDESPKLTPAPAKVLDRRPFLCKADNSMFRVHNVGLVSFAFS